MRSLTIDRGLATVDLGARFAAGQSDERMLAERHAARATLTSVATVDRVALLVEGKRVTRTVDGVSLSRPITMHYLADAERAGAQAAGREAARRRIQR